VREVDRDALEEPAHRYEGPGLLRCCVLEAGRPGSLARRRDRRAARAVRGRAAIVAAIVAAVVATTPPPDISPRPMRRKFRVTLGYLSG